MLFGEIPYICFHSICLSYQNCINFFTLTTAGINYHLLTATSDIEKEWLREIAAGDKNAFRKLFDAYRIQLFNFVYEFTHSSVDAEEIVQETFLKIWENREAMDRVEMPRPFIYTIVRNHTYNYLKKLARSEQLMREVWANMNHIVNDAEQLLLAKESLALISEAVAQLSEKKQAVFRMSRMQHLMKK